MRASITGRTCFYGWSIEDLDELDEKFDALSEHLGVEFVFEKVSDGSDSADTERVYARKKNKKSNPHPTL